MSMHQAPQELEDRLAGLLAHRYGDGTVYLPRTGTEGLFDIAVRAGLVSEEGFVTRKGRALLARHGH